MEYFLAFVSFPTQETANTVVGPSTKILAINPTLLQSEFHVYSHRIGATRSVSSNTVVMCPVTGVTPQKNRILRMDCSAVVAFVRRN